jgi:hypothetical protein
MKRFDTIKPIALENAWEMHRQHPDSFWVPPPQAIDELGAGDWVKVMAYHNAAPTPSCTGERFWVEIIARNKGVFIGRVDNRLLFGEGYPLGAVGLNDLIEFHACNICEVRSEQS